MTQTPRDRYTSLVSQYRAGTFDEDQRDAFEFARDEANREERPGTDEWRASFVAAFDDELHALVWVTGPVT